MPKNILVRLTDGLVVTRQSDIHPRRGTYTVLVVIEAPKPSPDLAEQLQHLRAVIAHLHRTREESDGYDNNTRSNSEQRIQDMEATMLLQPIQVSKRHKRGLFNFVGELGSTLFGTATAKQVRACKRQIEEARKLKQTIVHSYNEMTTVINQTRAEVSLNRAHLQKVETVVNNVFQQMVLTELSLTKTVTKVSTLEEEVIIDRLLAALESVHNLWLRHADRYRQQRASLELGQLTEEILSPHDLRSILDVSY